jgi:hypothetical protein
MQIIHKIDQLVTNLNQLKPSLSDDRLLNEKTFNELLQSSLQSDNYIDKATTASSAAEENLETGIPSWANSGYAYDPMNPRKPNMHELMIALSGKSLEDLYGEPVDSWHKIVSQSSETLYGVIGSNNDTRDWQSIMSSDDILEKARKETGFMYEPKVDIISNFNENEVLENQTAVIKDKQGNILRELANNVSSAEETLRNFGATRLSIPNDIETRVDQNKFDNNLLTFLKGFDKPSSVEEVAFQTAAKAISNKLLENIPIEEIAKL